MKMCLKRFLPALACMAAVLLPLLGGCANGTSDDGKTSDDGEGSVSFVIDSSLSRFIASRAEIASRRSVADDGVYIDVALLGDYSASKTVSITSESNITVSFDEIPIGSQVSVEASGYAMVSSQRKDFCSGSSSPITVTKGQNDVSVTMDMVPIYITSNGSIATGDGSEEHPLGSMTDVATLLALINYPGRYTVKVNGKITGAQEIPGTLTTALARSLTIEGTGSNAEFDGNSSLHSLQIATPVPVTIKNLKVTGGTVGISCGQTGLSADVTVSSGTNVQGNARGIEVVRGTVTLDGGNVKDNTTKGGVRVGTEGTFVMKNGEISGNSSDECGAGVYVYNTFKMEGGIIRGNQLTSSTGKGSAICPAYSSNRIILQGNIEISGDIYLTGYGKIELGGNISTTDGIALTLGSSASFWGPGTMILEGDPSVVGESSGGFSATIEDGGGIPMIGFDGTIQ